MLFCQIVNKGYGVVYKTYTRLERAKKAKKAKDKRCKDTYNYFKRVFKNRLEALEAYFIYLDSLNSNKTLKKKYYNTYFYEYHYIPVDKLKGDDKGIYVHRRIRAMVRDKLRTEKYEDIQDKTKYLYVKYKWGM